MNAAPGQQLDLFAGAADPPKLIDLMRVLTSTRAARPPCGCTCGYVQRSGVHTGLYCGGHGKWLAWLDQAGRERAKRANETEAKESEVRHGY